MKDNPQTRLNVNINSQTAASLKDYANKHDVTTTEALRRLVGYGDFIINARDEGKEVVLRQDGDIERVTFAH